MPCHSLDHSVHVHNSHSSRRSKIAQCVHAYEDEVYARSCITATYLNFILWKQFFGNSLIKMHSLASTSPTIFVVFFIIYYYLCCCGCLNVCVCARMCALNVFSLHTQAHQHTMYCVHTRNKKTIARMPEPHHLHINVCPHLLTHSFASRFRIGRLQNNWT